MDAFDQIRAMGFSEDRASFALAQYDNNVDRALNALLEEPRAREDSPLADAGAAASDDRDQGGV